MKLNIIPTSLFQSILLVFISLTNALFAQQKFDVSLLQDPETNGPKIADLLSTSEVFEYEKKKQNCIYLQNGLRASSFINEAEWNAIKDTVEVTRIDVVYSKYPLRSGVYHEIYPLLFDRLKALFQMDSELNDASIEFNKILQTHCENDAQVRSLFHGIVIHFSTIEIQEPEIKISETKTDRINNALDQKEAEQSTIQDMEAAVDRILELPGMPDSLKTIISKQPLDLQMKSIMSYLKEEIENEPDYELSELSPEKIDTFKQEINFFSSRYKSGDSVVHAVFNRHPEWKNILVVNDWTGSMYGYGAQVLDWHLKNFEKSGVLSLTLFNDGDMRPHHEKKVGETGGIYMEPADNVPQLVDLFNYVMLQGGGGDAPENNIEAILKSIETYERFSEIVLIADNNACIRDISLSDRIGVPVRVVVCGYDEKKGVNPHLVYLAKITNGGIYTIEDDLENIDTDLAEGGMLKSFKDKRFKLIKNACEDIELLSGQKIYKLKEGLRKKKKVIHLDASKEELSKVPGGVFKMSRLKTLDLSKNELGSLSPKVGSLGYLQTLDLSTNQLKDLPMELVFIRYLEKLDLSSNQFDSIPTALYSQKLLKNLNFSHNQLTYFDVSTLKSLQTLNLSNNQLTTLSKGVGKLKSLNFLDLSSNSFEKIPVSIYNLRKLKELDLSGNKITELPVDLRRLQQIKVLRLTGNPLSEAEKNRIRMGLKYTQIIF
jgi:Leucine-rich repeat (LRR) protein